MSAKFRPDIEGLRGIAVLLVVIYHAGFKSLGGGFVGVDIFFVISGFLITDLIRRQIVDGTFQFSDFYLRRIRRLFPAAFCTIIVSFLVAMALFSPADMSRMGGEAIYAVVAMSNLYYWLQAGYFDPDAISKPLLHTWSLSVEEQFYLVWPALIWTTLRVWARGLTAVILAVVATSTIGCLVMMQLDPTAAFFLTPFRMFEFAVGGYVSTLRPASSGVGRLSFWGGLVIVGWSAITYSGITPFPGAAAIPPVIGAALLIVGGTSRDAMRVLGNPLLRWFGRISYSLYLVHWPVAVFITYAAPIEMMPYLKPVLLIASVLAAVPLYYWVEKHFRVAASHSENLGFTLACSAAAMMFVSLSASAWASSGWIWRLPVEIRKVAAIPKETYENYLFSRNAVFSATKFAGDRPNILIVGDSQASDFLNVLVETGISNTANLKILPIETRCGAVLVPEAKRAEYWTKQNVWTAPKPDVATACQKLHDDFEASTDVADADVIVLASLWYPHTVEHVAPTVARLAEKSGARVVVVGRKTQNRGSIQLTSAHGRRLGLEEYAWNHRMAETNTINAALQAAVGDQFFDLLSWICPGHGRCHVLTTAGAPILFDQSHFSPEGAKFIGELASRDLVGLTTAAPRARSRHVSEVCRKDVQFVDEAGWHDCEKDGRWMRAMSSTLRVAFPADAKTLLLRGFTFGVQRRLTVSANGRIVHDAMIDVADIKVPLDANDVSPLDLKFEFEGRGPFSPKSIGVSADDRNLNFMLMEIAPGR